MERATDGAHPATTVAISLALRPGIELVGEIPCGLGSQRRVACVAFTTCAVATGAGRNAAGRNAFMVDGFTCAIRAGRGGGGLQRQARVILCDFLARLQIEPSGDPLHLRVAPRAGGKVFKLAQGIAFVETCKAGRQVAVALASGTVAGRTGAVRTCFAAAERDRFSGCLEWVNGPHGRGASGDAEGAKRNEERGRAGHRSPLQSQWWPTGSALRRLFGAVLLVTTVAGCKPPPQARHDFDAASIARGRGVVARAGCTACHTFPDISWPQGRAGPDLTSFDGRGQIAGVLPNIPANLAAFVRNAPSTKEGSTMPPMPITPSEARDVAAYLYGIAND
ncbi:Cytochrome c [Novosphingobium sp. B1]|nr:c-type cytochrome [Novosphingobium sp. B1]SMC38374.1 Cytochrome c [Novosphingobium sp. B1]